MGTITAAGGYEFVFDFERYTFTLSSSIWFCFALQDACRHIETTKPHKSVAA
jgi:hypothetical protein